MQRLSLITLCSSLALLGCASTGNSPYQPPRYDESHSRAFNLAHAGELVSGINDATLPADQSSRGLQDLAFGAGGALNPQFGMSSLQAGMLGFATALFGPDEQGARISFFGWIPASEASTAEAARKQMLNHIETAIRQGLTDLSASVANNKNGQENITRYPNVIGVGIREKSWGCDDITEARPHGCGVVFKVQEPRFGLIPQASGLSGNGFAFTSGDSTQYNKIIMVTEEDGTLPEDKLYAAISKHLPKGVFIYLAPRKVKSASGQKIKFPYILDQGKPELFVVPRAG